MKHKQRFEISKLSHSTGYTMKTVHAHSYYELFYLTQGECNFFLHNNTYLMTAGTLVFVPIDALHKTTYTGKGINERIAIEFSPEFIRDIIDDIGVKAFDSKMNYKFFTIPTQFKPMVNQITGQLLKEKGNSDIYSRGINRSYLHQLILLLLRHGNSNTISDNKLVGSDMIYDESIQLAMDYINDNYNNPITLNEMADYLHLNASYFSKKFKQVNGFGFKEYLNTVRINTSEKLLLETKLSMTEIAEQCGYETSNYFGDAFKKLNGVSPSEFRKIKGNLK